MGEKNPEEQVMDVLREHPRGLTISEIAHKIGINRNSTAKYLKTLEANGKVESYAGGTAQCFFLPRRLPKSVLLGLTTDLVCTFDSGRDLTFANDRFYDYFGLDKEEVRYSNIEDLVSKTGNDAAFPEGFAALLDEGNRVREIVLEKVREQVYLRARTIPTIFEDGSRGTTIIFDDITTEKKYLRNLEFLARISGELADMGEEENLFQYIGDRIAELEPTAHITVASINPETKTVEVRTFAGDLRIIEEFHREFGDPAMTPFSMANVPRAEQILSRGTLIQGPDSLYIQVFKMYPKEFCDEIQERLCLGKSYVMGCTCRGGLYGAIVIRLGKGEELSNRETVEAFVKQAGVALQRRNLREKNRRTEERISMLEGVAGDTSPRLISR